MRRQSVNTYYEHVYNNLTNADYDLFNGYLARSPLTVAHIHPPELISFNGKLENYYATLYWTIENKSDTGSYIIIERSSDRVHFKACSNIAAKNSGKAGTWSFTDTNPVYTNAWYRLRSADKQGIVTYSNIVLLSVIISQDLSFNPYGEN